MIFPHATRSAALKRRSGKAKTLWTTLAIPTACAVIACLLLVGCGSQPAAPAPAANPATAPPPERNAPATSAQVTSAAAGLTGDPHAGNIAKIQACMNTQSTEINRRLSDLVTDFPTPERTNAEWAIFANQFIYDAPGGTAMTLPGFDNQTGIGDCVTFPSDPLYPRIQPGTKRLLYSRFDVNGMISRPDLLGPDGPGDSERVLTVHLIHNDPQKQDDNRWTPDKETTTVHMKLFPITLKGTAWNTLLIWTE